MFVQAQNTFSEACALGGLNPSAFVTTEGNFFLESFEISPIVAMAVRIVAFEFL